MYKINQAFIQELRSLPAEYRTWGRRHSWGFQFQDLEVSAGAFLKFRSDFSEKSLENFLIANHPGYLTTGMNGIVPGSGNQFFHQRTQFLGFCQSGSDSTMPQE